MSIVKDYFSFTKRERTGVIVLVVLIVLIFVLPEFVSSSKKVSGLEVLSDFSHSPDSLNRNMNDSFDSFAASGQSRQVEGSFKERAGSSKPAKLYFFDPNTISVENWMELGISERTAGTIRKFLSKGGSFKKPEDIGKIYGLSEVQYARLLPYVRINAEAVIQKTSRKDLPHDGNRKMELRNTTVDINIADTTMLIALPGIGSKLANRIINFRNRLGGFYSVDQVREVYGLPDSTYQRIRPLLSTSSGIQKININEATVDQLKNHPYLKWNIANAIINYRSQHGAFEKVEDLLQIDIITPETLQRLKPYLELE